MLLRRSPPVDDCCVPLMRLHPAVRPLWPVAKKVYTVGTRTFAPLSMWLSRRRGNWLPQWCAATLDVAVHGTPGARLFEVRPADVLVRAAPTGHPRDLATLRRQTQLKIPRQAVAELPHARVLSPHAAVVTADGGYIEELNRYFGAYRWTEHPLFLHPAMRPPLTVPGRLAVLASRGDVNYFHFLAEVLPRIVTLAESGAEPPDRWYVPIAKPFQRELLCAMGVNLDDVVDSTTVPHVRADVLVVPTVPDLDLSAPRWVSAALRDRLLPSDAAVVPGRRIYVTRGRARRTRIVANEDDVLAELLPLGFEVVDPGTLPVAEQIGMFAEAELIVAPHGAALANLAFAGRGAAVIELFSPDYVQGCYWKLAETVPGLTYRYHVGRGRRPRRDVMEGLSSDIVVDVAVLLGQVRALLTSPK